MDILAVLSSNGIPNTSVISLFTQAWRNPYIWKNIDTEHSTELYSAQYNKMFQDIGQVIGEIQDFQDIGQMI